MKFHIQPPTGRREYVNLPEQEPDGLAREVRTGPPAIGRTLLGQSTPAGQSAETTHDPFADFLSDEESIDADTTLFDPPEASWRHSKWSGILFLAALAMLGAIWYMASRSDRELSLHSVKVEGAALLSNEEVLTLAAIDRTVPFYKINLKPIEERLLRHSFVRTAHVRRELYPATLVLSIEERQPVAVLSSDSSGEAFIVDRDGLLLRPKLIAGLRDPARLMQVPLLSGVSERDTAGYQAMAKMVTTISALDSGALRNAIGELHRTPTGAYVIYTSETQTPIFIGSPFDHAFRTALEEQMDSRSSGSAPKNEEPLFTRQLRLLARVWRAKLQSELRGSGALYVDARFSGQIILKHKTLNGIALRAASSVPISQANNNHSSYATNANKRSIN